MKKETQTPPKPSPPKPKIKPPSLSDLLDWIDEIILPDQLDIIISRANAVKKIRTIDGLSPGDIVRLSPECSPTLYEKYKNQDIPIESVDRSQMYHVSLGGLEGTFNREKLLLVSRKKV